METSLVIILGLFACVGGVVGWRLCGTIASLAGVSQRERDRERRDHHDLVLRLLEKREALPHQVMDLAHLHARERIEASRFNTSVEKAAIQENGKPQTPLPQVEPIFSNDPDQVSRAEMEGLYQ